MYPRLRFDISVRDFLFGFLACAWARRRRKLAEDVMRTCSSRNDELICLSVRSGFDLLLEAVALPAGSEVLVSAVTHPDMVRIIERHGLHAVPVDLDPDTLAPRSELFEHAISPRTRAIMVAHLFGGRVDLAPITDFARRRGLLLFEDCAQAFRGPHDIGDPLADVSMFSFGSLKTATALGGALLRVRDPRILEAVREKEASWPVQRRREYLAKLLKFSCLALVTHPTAYRLFVRACDLLGEDFDAVANSVTRSFAPRDRTRTAGSNRELLELIRRQPSAPLLALLARRLRTFDTARLVRRARIGEWVAHRLPRCISHPGRFATDRTHWIFPVLAPDPQALISKLRREGFDASRATSNISVVEPPADRPELTPNEAIRMMSNIVFLPVYPELSNEALHSLVEIVEAAAGDVQDPIGKTKVGA